MAYNRLERKRNPPAIKICTKGGMVDLFDNSMKEAFMINDEEYDLLSEALSLDNIDLLTSGSLNYSEAKQLLLAIKDIL